MESQDPDSTYVYDAFISYSRTDEAFGRRLEAALERYRPPRGIGHRLRVFRDVQDLVGNDLSQAIHDAVARSRCLIVICSPHARRSAYVAREIDAFGAAHGAERIIAALISGRPNKEVAAADPRQDQAFPEPLCRLFEEPLAADFRPHVGGTRWQRRTRYREALLSLLAFLLGVEKEELARRQQARTVRVVGVAALVALCLAIAFAGIAMQARRAESVAVQERNKAFSRLLSVNARALIPTEIDLALLLGVEAHRAYDRPEAWSSLLAALQHDARLVTFLRGHEGDVHSLAFSPDGSRLASGSADRTVRLWDTQTWTPLSPPLRGHEATVETLQFSQAGTRLISAGNDAIRRWDIETQRPLLPAMVIDDTFGGVIATAFSADRTRLAIASHFFIELFDLETWTPAGQPFGSSQRPWLSALAFESDGTLVTADMSGGIETWDTTHRRRLGPVFELGAPVVSLACSPDTARCASAGGWLRLWDARTRKSLGEPQRAHEGNIEALVFSPDGKRLLSRASDATARLWDVDSWQPHGPPLQQQGMIGGIAFSPDGTLVAVGSGHNITIWRVGARQRLARDLRTEQRPRAVAISPDGGRLLAGFDQGRVQLWDLDRQQPVGPPVRALPENMAVYEARFRPDGAAVALAGTDLVALWDPGTQQVRREARHGGRPHDHVSGLAFSRDGTRLASGGMDGIVRLWEADTLRSLGELRGHAGTVLTVTFSDDGKRLGSGSGDGTVRVWDTERLRAIGEPLRAGEPVVAVVFVDDEGRYLVSVDRAGDIRLWNVQAGGSEGIWHQHGRGDVLAASFGGDGQWMACLRRSPDGPRAAWISLWNVASHAAIDELLRADLDSSIPAWGNLSFSTHGQVLASGNSPEEIFLWDVEPAAWEREACRIANRNLSRGEWNRYVGEDVAYRCTCPGLPAGAGVAEPAAGCPPPTTP